MFSLNGGIQFLRKAQNVNNIFLEYSTVFQPTLSSGAVISEFSTQAFYCARGGKLLALSLTEFLSWNYVELLFLGFFQYLNPPILYQESVLLAKDLDEMIFFGFS